jgi:hypothetical protein
MFRPRAASDRIRKGMRMARKRYSDAKAGTTMAAKTRISPMAMRSCAMGKMARSAA